MASERMMKDEFFEEVASTIRQWTAISSTMMTDPAADLRFTDVAEAYRSCQVAFREAGTDPAVVAVVIEEALRGLAHSLFCIIDGATALSDHGRAVYLVDAAGDELAPALHEEFLGALLEPRPN